MFDLGRTILASAERDPGAEAIVDGDLRLTYGEWVDRILRVVAGLDGLGLKKGDRLLLLLQNRWEMATLHWAAQLAGVVVTPLNWRLKAEEVDRFARDSGAKALVFQDVSADAVSGCAEAGALPRLSVGAAEGGTGRFEDLLESPPAKAAARAGAEDLSILLYTSGTTGLGKGVPRKHRAERAAALAHVAQNLYRPGERTLGVMPLYHTMGVRSLLSMALVNGSFVCQGRFDPAKALRLLEQERVTCLYLVPTLYHDLLAHPDFGRTDLSSVRAVGFAGMSMTDGLLRQVSAAFRPRIFVNHFGSSEVYTYTLCQDAPAKPGSAGKAGLNQEIRVVRVGSQDPEATVPAGEEGEIIATLDGDEAFEGYWNRPDADAKALHGGWFFTGDVGHFDPDGDLFVTGRVDDMMITGGENVFPVEIESVLSLHPKVAEVAVAGLPDEKWGQRVTAFVRRAGQVTAEELDEHCRRSDLANFKRPRAYIFVPDVPKSPVGKILRRVLVEAARMDGK